MNRPNPRITTVVHQSGKAKTLAGVLVLTGLLWMAADLAPKAWSQNLLRGQVHLERGAEPVDDMLQGQVTDAQTGQPVPDANVTLPDKGYAMKTNPQGQYRIPRALGKDPVIMSVEKPGYVPFSITITETAPPVFGIKLQKLQQSLVLDNQLRHLGDGSFSLNSSNAMQFRKPPDGPAIRISFTLAGMSLSNSPSLRIGSIIGLDTPMAHFLSGNAMGVSASPLLVKVNGTVVARIQVNGDNQKVLIPRRVLREGNTANTLELEAGYHYPEPHRIDYDDMEFMHLVFYP